MAGPGLSLAPPTGSTDQARQRGSRNPGEATRARSATSARSDGPQGRTVRLDCRHIAQRDRAGRLRWRFDQYPIGGPELSQKASALKPLPSATGSPLLQATDAGSDELG
jgi:hypothetical protein